MTMPGDERGWRDIASAPRDGTKVLLWWDGDFAPVAHWQDGEWRYHMADQPFADIFLGYDPTNGCPYPQPTETQMKGEELARRNLALVIDPMAFDDGPFSTDAGDKQRQRVRQGIALTLADNIIAAGWVKSESHKCRE